MINFIRRKLGYKPSYLVSYSFSNKINSGNGHIYIMLDRKISRFQDITGIKKYIEEDSEPETENVCIINYKLIGWVKDSCD